MPSPLWKKILAGGLALGAGLHLASAEAAPATGEKSTPAEGGTDDVNDGTSRSGDPVAATPEWGRLQATLAEADEVASGRRGPYPFDKAGRDALLAAIATLDGDVDALAGRGFFAASAADLLKKEIAALADGVRAKRPKEMELATCYEPMPFEPGKASARRVAERVDALEALAAAGRVSPAVLARIRASLVRELSGLDEATLALMKGAERDRAAKNAARARKALARLAAAVPAPAPPAAGGDWAVVASAFDRGIRFAGPEGNRQAERDAAKAGFAAAEAAIVRLRDAGELGPAEADLLLAERKLVEADIFRNPPVDSQIKCYDMVALPAGSASLERVEARLSALEGAAKAGRLRPEVVARVRARLDADLAALRRAAQSKVPPPGAFHDRAEVKRAGEVLRRADEALKALDGR